MQKYKEREFILKLGKFVTSFIIYLLVYSLAGLFLDILFNNEYDQVTYAIRRIFQLILNIAYVSYVASIIKIKISYKINPLKLILYTIVLFALIFIYETTVDVFIDKVFTPDAASQSRGSSIQALLQYPVAFFIQACISAPLLEEFLVRGALYEILREKLSVAWSIAITGIFFTIMHFDSINSLFYIMISIIFSLIYIKTNNILYCVILHMFVNAFSLISYYLGNI